MVDVVLNIYDADGVHLGTFDDANPAATDRASVQMSAAGRIFLRVHNYTPNGNRTAYALSTAYVDNVLFTDIGGSQFESDIVWLAAAGVTNGCANGYFCPGATVSREQMASFLARALHLPATSNDYFTDDEQSIHEGAINSLRAAGYTTGCTETTFCPSDPVTREQMAAFLHRAFGS